MKFSQYEEDPITLRSACPPCLSDNDLFRLCGLNPHHLITASLFSFTRWPNDFITRSAISKTYSTLFIFPLCVAGR